MDLIDRLAIKHLRRLGFWGVRVDGPHGVHHLFDGPGHGPLPPVVLLHGFSSRATHLARLVALLQPHVQRILVPDLLGHGLSDPPPASGSNQQVAEGLFGVLDACLDKPAVLFGNSLGGMVGIRYASQRPDRVAGLFVTSPGGAPLPEAEHQRFLERFRPRDLDDARRLVDLAFATPPRFPDLAARNLLTRMRAPTVQTILDQMTEDDLLTADELARLRMPVRFLWGQGERILLPEHLAFFTAHLPAHADIERPDGYGHIPYFENAEDLARRLVDFAAVIADRAAA